MNTFKSGKYYKSLSLLSVLFIFTAISCNNHPDKKTAVTDFNEIDSLRATFLTIEDSLVHTWNVMINDDNRKMKSLYRLVQEVVFAGGVDTTITNNLLQQVKQLKSKRYTSKTMADSDLIDYYDSSSNALVNSIITLATSHEEFERNIVMNEMIDEINQAEGKILFFRLDYDDVAKIHNIFIAEHKELMKDINSEYNPDKLPVFELPTEQ